MSWNANPFGAGGPSEEDDGGSGAEGQVYNAAGEASEPLEGVMFYDEVDVNSGPLEEMPPADLAPAGNGNVPSWLLPVGLAVVAGGIAYAMSKRNRLAWAAGAGILAAVIGPGLIRRVSGGLGDRPHRYGGGGGGGDE